MSAVQKNNLEQGMDSGDISPKTKLHVAFNSGGKCCFPNCPKHLTLEGTNIGECAHIIPKKVGFVREDWQTPLEDRRKAANLIYVCSDHHAVIDNPDNAETYPASELHVWKERHEAWVLSQSKDTQIVPESVRKKLEETIASLSQELANEANLSAQLLTRLLTECKTLLRRRYLGKAEVLLSQLEMLLSDADNADLATELKALQANLLWKQGKIPEAKVMYLELLETSDHIEGMLDYVDLCYSAPEVGDKVAEYEEKAKQIAPEHPRLRLMELNRQYQQREKIKDIVKEEKWTADDWLNGQFYLTYALFFDLAGDLEQRDHFIAQWEKLLPESPRPNLFRILFSVVEAYRNGINNSEQALALLKKIQIYENAIFSEGKDSLSPHDQISLLVDKMKVHSIVLHFSIGDQAQLGEIRNELLPLLNNNYFDKHINDLLPEVLSTVLLDLPQWRGVVSSVMSSKVVPSADLVDLMFLQGIKLGIEATEVRRILTSFSRNDLSRLLDAIEERSVAGIIAAVDSKEEKFKLMLFQSINDASLRTELVQNIVLPEDTQIDQLYFQLEAFEATDDSKQAVSLAKQVDLENVTPAFLSLVNRVAYKYGEHRLFIESGEKLLDSKLPDEYRTEIHGKLATAYSRSDDDKNAYRCASEALRNPDHLGNVNIRILIVTCVNSLLALDKNDEAADFIEDHADKIRETPELGIFYAETVLKSAHEGKAEKAIEYVTQAFTHAPSNEERLYLPAFLVLNELSGLGAISAENKGEVGDGNFIKIDGLNDTWFYTGEEADAFGATAVNTSNPRYRAVIGKFLGDEVDWPADKYSSSKNTKKIAIILDRNGYFYAKSHEVMHAMARQGHEAIWSHTRTQAKSRRFPRIVTAARWSRHLPPFLFS